MHRYEELEKIYNRNLYFKIFIYCVILISVVGLLIFTIFDNMDIKQNSEKKILSQTKQVKENNKQPKTEKKIEKKTEKKIKKTAKKIDNKRIEKKENKFQNIQIHKLTLYPIYPDIELNKSDIKDTEKKEIVKKDKKIVKKDVVAESNKSIPKISPKVVTKQKDNSIKIIIETKEESLSDLIEASKNFPDYTKLMKIANIYFSQKNYQKSIEWAKKANKLQPEDYKSWYLFAKSLIQLGKTKDAKKVLKGYIETYGNQEKIQNLLRSIK